MHHRARDLTGQKLGYLTGIRYLHSNRKKKRAVWDVQCVCGTLKEMEAYDFQAQQKRKVIASCGCMKSKSIGLKIKKHGMYQHRAYSIWQHMLNRCGIPSNEEYKNYGARGIHVCERWKENFQNFWLDMEKGYAAH